MTFMIPPLHKIKAKGAHKTKVSRHERSTKRDQSYFEHVDNLHSRKEPSSEITS